MQKKESRLEEILNKLFVDDKKRHLNTLFVILPFLIIIIICGILIFKEAKGLIGNISSETGSEAVSSAYSIYDGNFVLRDNATDIQKEYFKELKNMYEKKSSEITDEDKAALTVKNFIADFYTLSNKQGQYDVGGMYYVYEPQRKTIYIQARDQFYKYLNQYINKYGSDKLLEVESVEIISSKEIDEACTVLLTNEETNEEYSEDYTMYSVRASWAYKSKDGGFNTSSYDTSGYFMVVNHNGRFEIGYAGKEEYKPAE